MCVSDVAEDGELTARSKRSSKHPSHLSARLDNSDTDSVISETKSYVSVVDLQVPKGRGLKTG